MLEFKFKNHDIDIDIEGNKFILPCTTDTGDYFIKFAKELRALAAEIEEGKKTTEDAVIYCSGAVDKILGEGAADKIFENRKKRLSDISDLLNFLIVTVAEHNAK